MKNDTNHSMVLVGLDSSTATTTTSTIHTPDDDDDEYEYDYEALLQVMMKEDNVGHPPDANHTTNTTTATPNTTNPAFTYRNVTVNQRALIDKILARYATTFSCFRELLQNSNDANATTAHFHFVTTTENDVSESESDDTGSSSKSKRNRNSTSNNNNTKNSYNSIR